MQDFRKVVAWQKAHALVLKLYQQTASFPREETFGVTMQLRRGAMGIAMQIAEGAGRPNNGEFSTDLRKAASGCNELEYLVMLAGDLGYWDAEACDGLTEQVSEVRRIIFGLLRTF